MYGAFARRTRRRIALVTLAFFVSSNLASAQTITLDGRTDTFIEINGNVTDISTSTISGRDAFNAFDLFNVDRGNVVNLHLPSGTDNLINLVDGGASYVHGMLNSIKDGTIGGNVYFLNPYGLLVGPTGSVNVGSFTALTPTKQFVEGFFDAPGVPSAGAVAAVKNGSAPIDPDGLISITGQLNAVGDIDLSAGTVTNSGVIASGAAFTGSAPDFSDIVNVNGLQTAARIAMQSGQIEIRAAGDVINSGTVAADGADGLDAGTVSLKAGGDVLLAPGSVLSARGRGADSNGGRVDVYAGDDATFSAGAAIDVRGGDVSGDGGAAELSAADTVTLAGGTFRAGATSGRAGSVLIDPDEIDVTADQLTGGGDFILEADDRITVASGVTISTQQLNDLGVSVGDSGDITLSAPEITVNAGARLFAQAINATGSDGLSLTDYASGDIFLTAVDHDQYTLLSPASTAITIDGAVLRGREIRLRAISTADYTWNDGTLESLIIEGATFLQNTFLAGTPLEEASVAVASSDSEARVSINSGSQLIAEGTVELSADSTARASLSSGGTTIGFAYGHVGSTAEVTVADGATIEAAALEMAAHNTADLNVDISATASDTYKIGSAIAVGHAAVDASVTIASGAIIRAPNGGSIDVAVHA
ncbi:MAG TPA: leukotoxin LktA family filamentous adhesin, partial [Limnochordia bacterium]